MAILRGKAAAVVMTAALAGGVGVMVGGFVEDQRSDETLDFVESSKEEQLGSLQEHRAETDVCMAEAEARAKPEDGMFGVITDPQLDKCYAEQELKVAEINAEASR